MGRIARVWENRIFEVKPPKSKRKSPENHWFSGLGGGDKRDRTADLLNAIQALSQLSYTPIFGSLLCDSFAIIATNRQNVKGYFMFFAILF